ncbi:MULTISPECIES: ABC transporter permease [unclassified Caballeronia]|uniref:ABC transporter permease n=1 Tax=unclassified Caballeronia TaxID=2646786 RepID=UPI0020280693|nr:MULTISPECIES: ABC transporter permease [unclassified Caballeronia]
MSTVNTAPLPERMKPTFEAKKAERAARLKALLFVLPLLLFLVVLFVLPIAEMLARSVDNRLVANAFARTHMALEDWDYKGVPGNEACNAVLADLRDARVGETLGSAVRVLGYSFPGANSLLMKTARRAGVAMENANCMEGLASIDSQWAQPGVWSALKSNSSPITSENLLNAFDLRHSIEGGIERQPSDQRLYLQLYARTAEVSLSVTLISLVFAFPLAHLIATVSSKTSGYLLTLVLVPFWTSLLVRTTAWLVILQREGPLLDLLVWLHLVDGTDRPQLAYTTFASLIAMTHIMLPVMVLSLYSVMKGLSKDYVRASLSLGAGPVKTFCNVYIPQVMPGIATGCALVFISTLGFYVTPALVGGSQGQMVGNMIAFHMQSSLNWGLAASLSTALLVAVILVIVVFNRVVGLNKLGLAK